MKSSVATLVAFLGLVAMSLPAAAASPSVTVAIPTDRDAIIATPHKKNNDGSWGYGWIRKTTRSLIGFNIAPLEGRTVDDASIKLYVAQNNFTAGGTTIVAHPWEPSQGETDWVEGSNLFNRFGYCNKAAYRVEAREFPPLDDPTPHAREGATWKCSVDLDYLMPGTPNCEPTLIARARWSPTPPEGQRGIHDGFMKNIDARTTLGQNITTERRNVCHGSAPCDSSCDDSIACMRNGGTVDSCWRSIAINVTQDVRDALAIPGYRNVSWLIKRQNEFGEGGVHWFSREGATCNTGPEGDTGLVGLFKDLHPSKDSSALQPVLVVQLAGSVPVAIPTPARHCEAHE